jgi:hypothetical protein
MRCMVPAEVGEGRGDKVVMVTFLIPACRRTRLLDLDCPIDLMAVPWNVGQDKTLSLQMATLLIRIEQ